MGSSLEELPFLFFVFACGWGPVSNLTLSPTERMQGQEITQLLDGGIAGRVFISKSRLFAALAERHLSVSAREQKKKPFAKLGASHGFVSVSGGHGSKSRTPSEHPNPY